MREGEKNMESSATARMNVQGTVRADSQEITKSKRGVIDKTIIHFKSNNAERHFRAPNNFPHNLHAEQRKCSGGTYNLIDHPVNHGSKVVDDLDVLWI